jgi:hypothetical protein
MAQTRSPRPVLLAVDDYAHALAKIKHELSDRYDKDYRVVCLASAEMGIVELERCRRRARGQRARRPVDRACRPTLPQSGTLWSRGLEQSRKRFGASRRSHIGPRDESNWARPPMGLRTGRLIVRAHEQNYALAKKWSKTTGVP